jgi:hypothetical protein
MNQVHGRSEAPRGSAWCSETEIDLIQAKLRCDRSVAIGIATTRTDRSVSAIGTVAPVARSRSWRSARAGPGARVIAFIENVRHACCNLASAWSSFGAKPGPLPGRGGWPCRGDAEMLEIGDKRVSCDSGGVTRNL